MINDKNLSEFIEILYPYIEKKLISNNVFKECVKRKNATVVSAAETNIGDFVDVMFPYDNNSFLARNETGINLVQDDLVCIEYSIDLKNAVITYKI